MCFLLKEAAIKRPVTGNKGGSYLTLKSNYALVFGVIQLCSGSGTVYLDQTYWQRAIASRPTTSIRAYILGALLGLPFHSVLLRRSDSPPSPSQTILVFQRILRRRRPRKSQHGWQPHTLQVCYSEKEGQSHSSLSSS
jgi:hypothetical protein